jgi:hypothetical protein
MSTANGAPQGCENHVAVFFIAFSLFEQVRMAADAKRLWNSGAITAAW